MSIAVGRISKAGLAEYVHIVPYRCEKCSYECADQLTCGESLFCNHSTSYRIVLLPERTREIGLRLAVGAKARIEAQFLSEAVILSLFGSILGIFVGVASSFIVGHAFGWPMSIPLEALTVAPLSAVGLGVFFGFYPAWRAARLDPIVALRHE
ncbi:MAG TPA: FtsX-like permease family protein [Nitrospirota bacterium]|nr:FtsX-like permease family protein [Nitrospirota bacterium]